MSSVIEPLCERCSFDASVVSFEAMPEVGEDHVKCGNCGHVFRAWGWGLQPEPDDGPALARQRDPGPSSIEVLRQTSPNTHARWTQEEEDRLARGYRMGLTLDQLAELHGRVTGGIASRLVRLGLIPPV
jgi:hypothetical protein